MLSVFDELRLRHPVLVLVVFSAAILIIALLIAWGIHRKRKSRLQPLLRLRTEDEQAAFNPVSTSYSPKAYRRR